MSVIRGLLAIVGLAAAWSILSPSLDVRATSGTPTLPAATAAAPGECSDFVADLPSCADPVAARGGCDVYTRDADGQERLAVYTLADGTRVEEIGVDTWTEPAGCDPTRYER